MNVALAVGLASIAAVLSAQDPSRITGAGQVVDRDGKPASHAIVHFVHRPIPWCASYSEIDHQQVVADAAGRFRVELLRHRSYSAFATWEAEGSHRVTVVAEHCVAGVFAVLREQSAGVVLDRTRVEGLDAWAAFGPFALCVVPRMPDSFAAPAAMGEGGRVVLPSLPGSSAVLEIADARGETLWGSWVSYEPGDQYTLHVPAPVEVPIEVVDGDTGAPIAHAVVRHRSGWLGYYRAPYLDAADYSCERWRTVGHTDDRGRATITVPAVTSPWSEDEQKPRLHLVLAISAAGHADQIAGWNQGKPFFDQQVQEQNPKPLRIPLHRSRPVRGRLTVDGKRPAGNVDVLLFMEARCYEKAGGWSSWSAPVQLVQTDTDGRFEFPAAVQGRGPIRIGVPLWRPPLGGQGQPVPRTLLATPYAVAGTSGGSGREELQRDLGEDSLALDRVVRLRVVDEQGKPVQRIELGLTPIASPFEALGQRVTTDTAGRCDVILPPGEWLLWSVTRESGYLVHRLTYPAGAVPAEQVLTAQPFRYAMGRVMASGRPVGGATLSESGSKSGANGPTDWITPNALGRLNQWIMHCETDAQGRFRMPYIPLPGTTQRIAVYAADGQETLRAGFDLPLDPDTDPGTIEVTIGK